MPFVFFCALLFFTTTGKGQSVKEWTQQKKTRLQYLAQSVALLKGYAILAQKGYRLLQEGTDTITRVQGTTYRAQQEHLQALQCISPEVRQQGGLALSQGADFRRALAHLRTRLMQAPLLLPVEKEEAAAVLDQLAAAEATLRKAVHQLLTPGVWSLQEGERRARMLRTGRELDAAFLFLHHFKRALEAGVAQRMHHHFSALQLPTFYTP